jgi:hypothetical protein
MGRVLWSKDADDAELSQSNYAAADASGLVILEKAGMRDGNRCARLPESADPNEI